MNNRIGQHTILLPNRPKIAATAAIVGKKEGEGPLRNDFDQIIEDIDQYETYCAEHPNFKNNKAVLTIANIKSAYRKRLAANDFL